MAGRDVFDAINVTPEQLEEQAMAYAFAFYGVAIGTSVDPGNPTDTEKMDAVIGAFQTVGGALSAARLAMILAELRYQNELLSSLAIAAKAVNARR